MEMILTRIAKRDTYTIGKLFMNGHYVCDTLEPTWRNVGIGRPGHKIPGRTAIPEGYYAVVVTFSIKFKRWLPLLLNVPLFSGIRIHAGNTAADTQGCILPGYNRLVGRVDDSRICEREIMHRLSVRPEGEGIWLTVK
ncbi:hypothetical protein EVA_16803 [gut metagenome]|uniref:DUF5675 domain-containing protein n=1 Tax=gut metagenome TaxID=749906 RepID=J9G6J2_9ZZZZ